MMTNTEFGRAMRDAANGFQLPKRKPVRLFRALMIATVCPVALGLTTYLLYHFN